MKIQDKLIDDKKHLDRDITAAIEKINEYASLIDALAKKVELAKDALKYFSETYNMAEAKETLRQLEE